MKALIFGALGSIGSHIFKQFTNDNIETIFSENDGITNNENTERQVMSSSSI